MSGQTSKRGSWCAAPSRTERLLIALHVMLIVAVTRRISAREARELARAVRAMNRDARAGRPGGTCRRTVKAVEETARFSIAKRAGSTAERRRDVAKAEARARGVRIIR